jgi:DNA polymerase I-like protein with 3'-5' exonuclease and polymerase domains
MPFPTKRRQLNALKKLLEDPKIGKIAANMKYEDTWLNILHGIHVRPWKFDTMQAAHILDNRPGITGLKFQSYVQFGVLGYDDDAAPYLKSSDSYGVNRIMELISTKEGFRKLLLYNGIDSLMTYRLALPQMEVLRI